MMQEVNVVVLYAIIFELRSVYYPQSFLLQCLSWKLMHDEKARPWCSFKHWLSNFTISSVICMVQLQLKDLT